MNACHVGPPRHDLHSRETRRSKLKTKNYCSVGGTEQHIADTDRASRTFTTKARRSSDTVLIFLPNSLPEGTDVRRSFPCWLRDRRKGHKRQRVIALRFSFLKRVLCWLLSAFVFELHTPIESIEKRGDQQRCLTTVACQFHSPTEKQ